MNVTVVFYQLLGNYLQCHVTIETALLLLLAITVLLTLMAYYSTAVLPRPEVTVKKITVYHTLPVRRSHRHDALVI